MDLEVGKALWVNPAAPCGPWYRSRMAGKKRQFVQNLEIYAFWTGFMSTIISLLQVVIIALKK